MSIQKGQKVKFRTKYNEVLEGTVVDNDFTDGCNIKNGIVVEADYEDMGTISFIISTTQIF